MHLSLVRYYRDNDTGRNWITRGIFPAAGIETGEVGIQRWASLWASFCRHRESS